MKEQNNRLSLEKMRIAERLTIVEVLLKKQEEEEKEHYNCVIKRIDEIRTNHLSTIYNKIDNLTWWIIGLLATLLTSILINYFK